MANYEKIIIFIHKLKYVDMGKLSHENNYKVVRTGFIKFVKLTWSCIKGQVHIIIFERHPMWQIIFNNCLVFKDKNNIRIFFRSNLWNVAFKANLDVEISVNLIPVVTSTTRC